VGRCCGEWINYNIINIFFRLTELREGSATSIVSDALHCQNAEAMGVMRDLASAGVKWRYGWMETAARSHIDAITRCTATKAEEGK
jgi:hypothetical protein